MFYPTGNVISTSIAVSPVDEATAFIPLILAKKQHFVAPIQAIDPGRNVDVVGHKQGLSGFEFENEPLVPTAVIVIRE